MKKIFQIKIKRKILVRCAVLVGFYVQLPYTRVPSLSLFKNQYKNFQDIFFRECFQKTTSVFYWGWPSIWTQNHNVAITKGKSRHRFIYGVSTIEHKENVRIEHFTIEHFSYKSSKSDPIQSRLFWQ